MAAVATSHIAVAAGLRRRADLKLCPAPASGGAWLVEDPIASRYYELPADEFFLLRQFDGRTTAEEICRRYESAFAPRRLEPRRLDDFARRAYRQGLLTSAGDGQGAALRSRAARSRRSRLARALLNPLAVRLPGIDPEPVLSRLAPWCAFVFTRTFALFACLLAAAAAGTAWMHADVLASELRTATARLTPELLLSTALVTVGVKAIHELAHALACRKFGANCREIGMMLLVGVPCLYCDVTSIWMLPRRSRRIAVGAAGIAAELVVAAAAVLLWNASGPGAFHDVCLQIAVVCSVATVVFNGNPLLRYDGYFILTDLIGTTNLGERADAALRDRAARWFGGEGASEPVGGGLRRPGWWATYAAASAAYRVLLTVLIWWLLRMALRPYGLTLAADAVLGLSLVGMVAAPARRSVRFVRAGLADGSLDARRFRLRTAAALVLLAAALLWPWPYRVAAPAVTQAEGARHLFVAAPGRIVAAKQLGDTVRAGDVVAQLENLDIERELARLRRETAERRKTVDNLERRRIDDPAAGAELPAARQAAEAAEERLRLRQEESARLRITAPCDGVLLPLPARLQAPQAPDDDPALEPSDGSPLESVRRGGYLEAGTPLCTVGPAERREAVLVVARGEIEFVRTGAAVRLQFDSAGARVWRGRVVDSTSLGAEDAPPELTALGLLRMEDGPDGKPRPAAGDFLVRVAIDEAAGELPVGAVGQARVEAERQSLARRFLRFASETFRIGDDADPRL